MWLIDTQTLALKLFQDDRTAVGKYAILSHRWQKEEVLFGNLAVGRNVEVPPATKLKYGFSKVDKACAQARDDGYRYMWIDTCCINKESSAELSEAIASMWRWYCDAAVCYAYLCDVDLELAVEQSTKRLRSLLSRSVWFKRGWTLQELIAPSNLIFYDRYWKKIGVKSDMTRILETITGIGENALRSRDMVSSYCIAKRMAWAAKRETTRVEDEAYCLLGIFNVSMPTMYGEGQRAFLRLQEEIVRTSTDHSIFAWELGEDGFLDHFNSLFAPNLRHFLGLGLQKSIIEDLADDESYELTNRGLNISLPVHRYGDDMLWAMLNCVPRKDRKRDAVVAVVLQIHERQNKLAPKQNLRAVCEIVRSYRANTFFRTDLEPLEWMDLTILRHGLTSEVLVRVFSRLDSVSDDDIEVMIFNGNKPPSHGSYYNGRKCLRLENPTGRPLSGGYVAFPSATEDRQVYLCLGQCLRQPSSYATFRMCWSSSPMSEHQLLLQEPTSHAFTDLFGFPEEVVVAEAATLLKKRHWIVEIFKISHSPESQNTSESSQYGQDTSRYPPGKQQKMKTRNRKIERRKELVDRRKAPTEQNEEQTSTATKDESAGNVVSQEILREA